MRRALLGCSGKENLLPLKESHGEPISLSLSVCLYEHETTLPYWLLAASQPTIMEETKPSTKFTHNKGKALEK